MPLSETPARRLRWVVRSALLVHLLVRAQKETASAAQARQISLGSSGDAR